VTHVEPTASPGHPGAHRIDFVVVAVDGRAGRVEAATVAAAPEQLVVRGRPADRWRRRIVRRDEVTDIGRDARVVHVPLTRAEIAVGRPPPVSP
jgi:hypothetical protein